MDKVDQNQTPPSLL